jgi:hypothetical protein
MSNIVSMTSLDRFALPISPAPALSCQQNHESHMDGDLPMHSLVSKPLTQPCQSSQALS